MRSEAEGERAIKESMVQCLDSDGKVRGCGLLVDSWHVITCAHVVALAIPGVSAEQRDKPLEPVRVAFPYRGLTGETYASDVIVWKPVVKDRSSCPVEDIAVLKLKRPAPAESVPHSLLDVTEWAGRSYMAHGFTESEPEGAWA